MTKLLQLIAAPHRLDRIGVFFDLRLASLTSDRQPATPDFAALDDLVERCESIPDALRTFLAHERGEAEQALEVVRRRFQAVSDRGGELPFPTFYNADHTYAILSYALARQLRVRTVVETGVGYGVTTAMVALAMERNGFGRLTSIDLPPLNAASGKYTGVLVPEHALSRWSLKLGSSRRLLRRVVDEVGQIDLFLSDSANIFALERHELRTVWKSLRPGGAAIFNNIPGKFQEYVRRMPNAKIIGIEQKDKPPMVTGLILRPRQPAQR